MAKKFGKLLLLGAAIGSVAGAVYYFKKKEAELDEITEDDYDDFSDIEDDESESSRSYVSLNSDTAAEKTAESDNTEETSQNTSGEMPEDNIPTGQSMFQEYASADNFFEETSSTAEPSKNEDSQNGSNSQNENESSNENNSLNENFTPLTEQVSNAADQAGESVEEFFDEEDAPGVEPPINDN